MDTLRVFIEWCETIDAVQHGLFKKIKSPVIPDGGNVRDTTLTTDRANEILDHLKNTNTPLSSTLPCSCWSRRYADGWRSRA